ncbi:hypothetical protein [Methylorubrum sp. SL192]|uniref:hypothetical protein n=1 Tax=Methylorubrum sp. SL192 TaxID=2995167 RepID=UPI002273B9FF|nr:hypothetical protein [Methylorubrum sp. SL192]MCY1644761.1 hypothetical protein [Methylorubrum sp. SL192]
MALTACLLTAGTVLASANPARLEKGIVPSGPAKAVVERWFTAGSGPICSDANGADAPCDLGRALAFRTFYAAGGTDALVFAHYSPSVGNAVSLAVAQFRRAGQDWTLVRTVTGVYGEGPDSLSFEGGRATFTMDALMPGDARCCLTGKQRYTLDLATGTVTAGPKTAAKATPASGKRSFAPRPEGFEGATYFHNGSEVLVDERVGVIRYDVPKTSIRAAVSKGTVLFRGTFAASGAVTGTAYVFKAGCEPAPYAVSGHSKGSTITLKGNAPVAIRTPVPSPGRLRAARTLS